MRKKILLPTDFSRNAWDAIAYAIDLYRDRPCDFYILNVYDFSGFAMDNIIIPQPKNDYVDKVMEKSMAGLNDILTRLSFRDDGRDHKYFTISKQDSLLKAIKEIVELKDIDMVIMGTKGDTDSLNVTYGSNTVMMMEKVRNCPVMAIPSGTLFKNPSEIVFVTSFKTHIKKTELNHLIEIAKITSAPIRVLHVANEDKLSEVQKNYKAMLEEYFEEIEYSFHTILETDIATALDMFVQSRNSEMICFINKKHTFFGSIFSNPLVKDLGVRTKVPLLALHDLRN